jgi:hypothetical protein
MKIASEMTRLKAFSASFPAVSLDLETVEMFMESTIALLDEMQNALLRHDPDDTFLLQAMNDDEQSNSILYYFKVCNSRTQGGRELIPRALLFRAWLTLSAPDEYVHATQREPVRAFPGNDSTSILQNPHRGSCPRDRTGWAPSPYRRHHCTGRNSSGSTLP